MNKEEFINKYKMRQIKQSDGVLIEMRYATSNNFTKNILYDNDICILRESTAIKLLEANLKLKEYGFKLKIWDAFRPIIYQRKMWQICPDERFVAKPDGNNANHCKGNAVDVTLCTLEGKEAKMPTEYDCFGQESHRGYYKGLSKEAKRNVMLLEEIMIQSGFLPFDSEWWHFNDADDYNIIYEMFEQKQFIEK